MTWTRRRLATVKDQSCWRTRAKISTISRSPPGVLSVRCCRARKAGGSSANGAPLRSPGLALNDRQIAPPVVDRCGALPLVRVDEDATMLADDLPLGDDDDSLGIYANETSARPIGGERRRQLKRWDGWRVARIERRLRRREAEGQRLRERMAAKSARWGGEAIARAGLGGSKSFYCRLRFE